MRDISGPMHMLHYDVLHELGRRVQREARRPAMPPLSNRRLAELTNTGKSGATVKAWKERMKLLGPPPKAGNLGLLLDYYRSVFDPRGR